MPRRRVPTRISDPDVRLVAGRMIYAAAAEALGCMYGPVAMERALAFSPGARAQRCSSQLEGKSPPVRRPLPTGTCKKWLKGHVPLDQTLTLIANQNVARRMRQVRDGDIVKALSVAENNYRFVGSRIAALSPDLFGKYLACMALGQCNPDFASGLSSSLLQLSMTEHGPEVLVAVLGVDRQMAYPRGPEAAKILNKAFDLALRQAASAQTEVAFSKAAIAEVWSHRMSEQERADGGRRRRKSS